jgi:hypothetical protein
MLSSCGYEIADLRLFARASSLCAGFILLEKENLELYGLKKE